MRLLVGSTLSINTYGVYQNIKHDDVFKVGFQSDGWLQLVGISIDSIAIFIIFFSIYKIKKNDSNPENQEINREQSLFIKS